MGGPGARQRGRPGPIRPGEPPTPGLMMNTAPAWALRGLGGETATQVIGNDDPRVLIAEANPYGSLEAAVENDGRAVYLYLQHVTDDE